MCAVLGLLVNTWTLLDAVSNLRAVYRAIELQIARRGGPRWWIAWGELVSNIGWSLVFLDITLIGVWSISGTLDGWAGPMLVVMVILMGYTALWNRFIREKLRSLV
jgi:hypothetical protein